METSMKKPNFEGSDYEPYELEYPPEEYADFEWAEDRGDIQDLEVDREPCGFCGGHLNPRGAFGARVVFECLGCRTMMTVVMEGWAGAEEDEWDEDEDQEWEP